MGLVCMLVILMRHVIDVVLLHVCYGFINSYNFSVSAVQENAPAVVTVTKINLHSNLVCLITLLYLFIHF